MKFPGSLKRAPHQQNKIIVEPMSELGRFLIIIGVLLVIVGAVLLLAPKLPWLGRLPGDISFKRGNVSFYFPLGTCILISVILTLIMYLFRK